MTREEYLLIIDDFTKKFETVEFEFYGVDWWPLIKIQVAYKLHLLYAKGSFEFNYTNEYCLEQPVPKIKVYDKLIYFIFRYFKQNKYTSKIGVFTFSGNKTTPFKNQFINQYTQPFIDYFNELKISYNLYEHENPSNFILKLKKYYKAKVIRDFNTKRTFQRLIYEFSTYVENQASNKFMLYDTLIKTIINTQAEYLSYKVYLSKTNHKSILFYCYYNCSNMAVNRAAKELNITTIEYQHSTISNTHFAYGGWSERIQKAENFFPSIIWTWTDTTAHILNKRSFNHLNAFKSITGGNLYLNRYSFPKKERAKMKSALVTFQGVGLPDFIIDSIKKSTDIRWYLRLHPRYDSDKELIEELKNLHPKLVEIEKSNKLSLLELLSIVDFHITCFSGSALEAEMLGVQNIIWGKEGYETYKKQISNGTYLYIRSYSELENIIHSTTKSVNYSAMFLNKNEINSIFQSVFQPVVSYE